MNHLKFGDVCLGGVVEQRVAVVQFCTDDGAGDDLEDFWW